MMDTNNVYVKRDLSHRMLITAAVLICWAPVGCLSGHRDFKSAADLQTQKITDIPPVLLKKSGLQLSFPAIQLPLDQDRIVKRLFHRSGQIYALTDRNQLFALDADTGSLLWSRQLPAPLAVCSEVNFYENNLLVVISDTMIQIRQSDGEILLRQPFKFPVSTNAARTETMYFAGSHNRRFYCLDLSNGTTNWQNICTAKPTGRVIVAGELVYFVTEDHNLLVSKIDQRELVWQHRAFGALPGVIVDQNQCFLPSADTVLYCFDAVSGNLQWKHLAGGRLRELPTITTTAVYQPVEQKSLLCLERQSDGEMGNLRWELDRGRCLLAALDAVSYCLTLDDEITMVDNLSGQILTRFHVPQVDLYVHNAETTQIFLASQNGAILALQPNSE